MIAEYSAFEEIAALCAQLAAYDSRFAAVGRRAEDQQYVRHTALSNTGFGLPPHERTAEILGRTYQLPDVTASVVRELFSPVALLPPGDLGERETLVANHMEDLTMSTMQTIDPNPKLNGQYPAVQADEGMLGFVKRQCTVRNGVIAGTVLLLTTAVYLAVTQSSDATA